MYRCCSGFLWGCGVEDDDASYLGNPNSSLVRALEKEKVRDKLLFFLNFEDIKALSVVSVGCLKSTRESKLFSEKARLIISRGSVASQVHKKTRYQWRHISMDLDIPCWKFNKITNLLQSAYSLTLWQSSQTEGSDSKGNKISRYLTDIFRRGTTPTNSLQSLEIDASILSNELVDVFSSPLVQSMLARLENFAIQNVPSSTPIKIWLIDGLSPEMKYPFQRNMRQLAEVQYNLKRFVFGKVLNKHGVLKLGHVKHIPTIINATKDTLEELELHLNVWKLPEMKEISCPKLKRLVFSFWGNDNEVGIVEAFLKNQPPLEHLVFEIRKNFPFSIIQALNGLVLTKMKKLHIKARRFGEPMMEPLNWTFLENMENLKDFRIRKPTVPDVSGQEIDKYGEETLAKLPAHVEKIFLQGFQPFWKEKLQPPGNIGDLLNRFVNLTEINLLRSGNAVTDEGMQSIIMNCKKLTSLVISHCFKITDFGISGIRESEDGTSEETVGVSLKHLKGLINLKIRSCPHISPDGLLKVLEFDFLRFIDYIGYSHISKDDILKIVKRNPCLEQMTFYFTYTEKYDIEFLRLVTTMNPRVRLHRSVYCTENWEDKDSESDMSRHKVRFTNISRGSDNADCVQNGFQCDVIRQILLG